MAISTDANAATSVASVGKTGRNAWGSPRSRRWRTVDRSSMGLPFPLRMAGAEVRPRDVQLHDVRDLARDEDRRLEAVTDEPVGAHLVVEIGRPGFR